MDNAFVYNILGCICGLAFILLIVALISPTIEDKKEEESSLNDFMIRRFLRKE